MAPMGHYNDTLFIYANRNRWTLVLTYQTHVLAQRTLVLT
jgi:hypothetical protein